MTMPRRKLPAVALPTPVKLHDACKLSASADAALGDGGLPHIGGSGGGTSIPQWPVQAQADNVLRLGHFRIDIGASDSPGSSAPARNRLQAAQDGVRTGALVLPASSYISISRSQIDLTGSIASARRIGTPSASHRLQAPTTRRSRQPCFLPVPHVVSAAMRLGHGSIASFVHNHTDHVRLAIVAAGRIGSERNRTPVRSGETSINSL